MTSLANYVGSTPLLAILLLGIAAAAGVLFSAGVATLLIRRSMVGVSNRRTRLALALAAGLAAVIVCGAMVLGWVLLLPAADSALVGTRVVSVSVGPPARETAGEGSDFFGVVELRVPVSARVGEDSQLELNISGHQRDVLPPSVLRISEVAFPRGSPPCPMTPLAKNEVGACGIGYGTEVFAHPRGATVSYVISQYRWLVRSNEPGRFIATVVFPQQVVESLPFFWFATVRESGKAWTVRQRPEGKEEHMSKANPIAIQGDTEVNLRAGQITFPISFDTAIGLSKRTYTLLALLGAAASGMLGSGWVWQLLSRLRPSAQKEPRHKPFRPGRNR